MPELPCDDVSAAVTHYRDVLGFVVNYQQDDIGVLDRDEGAARVQHPGSRTPPADVRADLRVGCGAQLHCKGGVMTRRLRYQVAVSLDGFIAGPNGDYDWIVMDPAIDFAALYAEFDTAVMGRKTYEVLTAQGGHGAMPGLDVVVFSRTLPAASIGRPHRQRRSA